MDRIFEDVETGHPALRHWKDVEVVMDESMEVDGEIVLHGGTHRDTVRLQFRDWFDMVKPKVVHSPSSRTGRDIDRSRIARTSTPTPEAWRRWNRRHAGRGSMVMPAGRA